MLAPWQGVVPPSCHVFYLSGLSRKRVKPLHSSIVSIEFSLGVY